MGLSPSTDVAARASASACACAGEDSDPAPSSRAACCAISASGLSFVAWPSAASRFGKIANSLLKPVMSNTWRTEAFRPHSFSSPLPPSSFLASASRTRKPALLT
jgi:hypothetical protein